jgi:hypothetical protein
MPAKQQIPHDHARRLVEENVRLHIKKWAAIIDLAPDDPRIERFRDDMTGALHRCMRVHIGSPYLRYKRPADVRKDFEALAEEATAAAKKLDAVEVILERLPPMYHKPAFRLAHPPGPVAFELKGLAEAAREHADEWKSRDLGGVQGMQAFRALAEDLLLAYRRVTKKKGVRSRRLLKLVEAVLSVASAIAKAATNRPLKTSRNLGEYLHTITSKK